MMMIVCQRDVFADKVWNRDRSFMIVVRFLRTVVSDLERGEFPGNRLHVRRIVVGRIFGFFRGTYYRIRWNSKAARALINH